MLDERLDRYVVNLRENEFPVEIDEKTLNQLAQREVDQYVQISKTKELSPEEVKEKIEKLRK